MRVVDSNVGNSQAVLHEDGVYSNLFSGRNMYVTLDLGAVIPVSNVFVKSTITDYDYCTGLGCFRWMPHYSTDGQTWTPPTDADPAFPPYVGYRFGRYPSSFWIGLNYPPGTPISARYIRINLWDTGSYQVPIDAVKIQTNTYMGSRLYADRTYAPEDACLANNPQATAADPVNTYTGNFHHQETDVTLPSRGLPLTFERSYNSLDSYAGPLGVGWTHSYNMALSVYSNTVTLMAPYGSRLRFNRQAGGGYTADAGVRAELEELDGGSYRLTQGDRVVYNFDFSGRLTSLVDTVAVTGTVPNTTSLAYNGNDQLASINAPDGRTLTLTYDANGYLTGVTDPLGRTVTYTYTNGYLTGVTDRRGKATSYGYTSGLLTGLTDANGYTVTNTYDAVGRVVSQSDRRGKVTGFSYNGGQTAVTDPRQQTTTYTYDGLGQLASVTDARQQTTQYTYDEEHNLASVTDPLQRTTSYNWATCGCKLGNITDAQGHTTSMVYDEHNNLIQITDPMSRTTDFGYDSSAGRDNLVLVTNTLGVTISFTYDSYGQVVSSRDANGHTTSYSYDNYGNLTTLDQPESAASHMGYDLVGQVTVITDANGHASRYEYDAGDNLVRVTDALNGETEYAYDDVGNLVGVTDAGNHTSIFTYTADSRIEAKTDARSETTRYSYDDAGNLATVTDSAGQTAYTYDALNQLESVEDALGHTSRYGYDAVGNLTVFTDATNIATHYGYDSLYRLVSVIQNYQDGQAGGANDEDVITQYGYDAAGNRTTITDANGHTTGFGYDGLNRLVSRSDALNHTWSYGYDAAGNMVTLLDARGQTTGYSYDSLGRLVGIDYPGGQGDVSFSYDAVGNRLTMTDPTGQTTYTYDALNQLESVEDTLGNTSLYGYDEVGNLTVFTDATNIATHYGYDSLYRLVSVIQNYQDGQVGGANDEDVITQYGYDAAGNRTTITDANGHTTSFGYDGLNRLVSRSDALNHTWSYGYDAAGNMITLLDARGQTTGYSYDSLGRLVGIDYPGGQGDVSFTYDAVGNRLTMTDPTGQTTYAYDALDQPTAISQPGVGTVEYDYDEVGHLTELEYPDDRTVSYDYDDAGWLETVTDWDSKEYEYTYDAAGRVTLVNLPVGVDNHYRYDIGGRLVCLDYTDENNRTEALAGYRYTLDAVGNRTQAEEAQTPCNGVQLLPILLKSEAIQAAEDEAASAAWEGERRGSAGLAAPLPSRPAGRTAWWEQVVDWLGENVFTPGPVVRGDLEQVIPYAFGSPMRSRTAATSAAISYSYDSLYRLTEADTGAESYSYSYDGVGNRTSLVITTTTTYQYDAADRLTSVGGQNYTFDDNGNKTSDGVHTLTYDAADRLVSISGGGVNASFSYNGDGLRVAQTVNNVTTTFAWDMGASLPQVLATNNAAYVYGVGLLGQEVGEAWYYPLADGLGSLRRWTDDDGDEVYAVDYTPFGGLAGASGASPSAWGYAGEYQEGQSGLIYLRARWYDPATGRFLTRDPFAGIPTIPATLNPYVYALNNPVMYTDPSGEVIPLLALLALGLAGGMLGGVGYYGIETVANANPCTGPAWNWNQAAFWGTIGAPIGAAVAFIGYAAWMAGSGLVVSEGAGMRAAAATQPETSSSVWDLPQLERGRAIEGMLGHSPELVQNYPVIDRFENGVATSIKSIDLRAASYQNTVTLTSKVKGYINVMAAYQGQSRAWAGTSIEPQQIMGRAVDLAVPSGIATDTQAAALAAMQAYANSVGVTLNLYYIP